MDLDDQIMGDFLQALGNTDASIFETQSLTSPASMASPISPSPTLTHCSRQSPPSNIAKDYPYIQIVEQPHPKGLRFRYICEGRSAGSIPGINTSAENKTFPSIEIVGYVGPVTIIVSCVTADEPYRPHPHNLVGREGCESGIYKMQLNGAPMRAVFSNLGIQCVKKKDIKAALEERERINVDPFKTKFAHKEQPSSIDLNIVRLCFQAFIPNGHGKLYKLKPVVTEPIYDKKSINDLIICRLCSCSAKASGGDEIFLLCEKLPKDDIKVRFFEERDNEVIWEDYGEFQQTDIHKQTAIAFKTPRYRNTDIENSVQVFIQLVRISTEPPVDGKALFSQISDPLPFEFNPDPGTLSFPRLQRKLKRRKDLEIFQQILSLDSETTATKYSEISNNIELEENDNDSDDTVTTDSSTSHVQSSGTINGNDGMLKRFNASLDEVEHENVHKFSDKGIDFPIPQINLPSIDDFTQTSTPIEEILRNTELGAGREFSAIDKITEWMKSNEFERTDSLTVENGDAKESVSGIDDSQMNTELIEQDIELFDQPELELLDRYSVARQDMDYVRADVIDTPPSTEIYFSGTCMQESVCLDEQSDDDETYTSLQIALGNPLEIPELESENYVLQPYVEEINTRSNLMFFSNIFAPEIQINAAQPCQSPPSPPLPLPPRTPSPVPEQMLPPLPPKRKPSQELEVVPLTDCSTSNEEGEEIAHRPISQILFTNTADECTTNYTDSSALGSRAVSQITLTITPEQSPTKQSCNSSPSPNKNQGFFSRLFFRRKSKPDDTKGDGHTPCQSRKSSIRYFSWNDTNRNSVRSAKSLQPYSEDVDKKHTSSAVRSGQIVGRSVSSVSGKRPAYREGDIIHIPLKGEFCRIPVKNFSDCGLDRALLNHKSVSALQLTNVSQSEGVEMELYSPTEQLFESHLRHKRLRLEPNSSVRILQELQQMGQIHNNNCNDNMTNSLWNIPPPSLSPANTVVPEIKNEPYLSPNPFGTYRATYQMSPSPQPLSPLNRCNATPSPGLMKTPSAESQTQMCDVFMQHQINNNNYNTNVNANQNNNYSIANSLSTYSNRNQLHPTNLFQNPTSGGSITPLYPNENNGNLSNTSHFHAFNIASNFSVPADVSATPMLHNQFPSQPSQCQQLDEANQADLTLDTLLQFDSDKFVNINSEELRLSNMSISIS